MLENISSHQVMKDLFPYSEIDNYGIMTPFHSSISGAIISLVENPDDSEAQVPSDYEDIVNNIREVNNIDIDISIKEKAENRFINKYKSFVMKAMDYYLEKKLNREIQRRGSISNKSAYNFLSRFNQPSPRIELEFNWEIEGKYSEKFRQILENHTIHYINLESSID